MNLSDYGFKDAGLSESQAEAVIVASREISDLLNIPNSEVGKGIVLTPVLHDYPTFRIAREIIMEVGPKCTSIDFVYNWVSAISRYSKAEKIKIALSDLLYVDIPKSQAIKQIANKWKNAELGISSTLSSLCVEFSHLNNIQQITREFHGRLDSSMPLTSVEASYAIRDLRSRISDAGGSYDSDSFVLLVSFIEMRAECAKSIEEVSLIAGEHVQMPIAYLSRIQNAETDEYLVDATSNVITSVISSRLVSSAKYPEHGYQLTADEVAEVESRISAVTEALGHSSVPNPALKPSSM